MILIADSGSTKTEWCLTSKGSIMGKCTTSGINPFYQTSAEILKNLEEEFTLCKASPQEIHFYGAGCANEEKNNIVKKGLSDYFNCEMITIESDLLGAARSLCQHETGIACILGTGSNSCLYDGKGIIQNVSPLGFILGDEGSGAALGKKLIGDLLKNQVPSDIKQLFFKKHPCTPAEILDNVYKKPFPNRYLAQYTKFLSENIHLKEIEAIVLQAFSDFIERNLLQYPNVKGLHIHFTGSIAFYFKEHLEKTLQKYQLTTGDIKQTPMSGLVQYHTSSN